MRVVHKRCAGLDVHQKSITACVRVALKRKVVRETRVFGTATSELLKMADWLGQSGCTIVAMEATGVYWKPVWHVLEGHFELVLAQPAHAWSPRAQHVRDQVADRLGPLVTLRRRPAGGFKRGRGFIQFGHRSTQVL